MRASLPFPSPSLWLANNLLLLPVEVLDQSRTTVSAGKGSDVSGQKWVKEEVMFGEGSHFTGKHE